MERTKNIDIIYGNDFFLISFIIQNTFLEKSSLFIRLIKTTKLIIFFNINELSSDFFLSLTLF